MEIMPNKIEKKEEEEVEVEEKAEEESEEEAEEEEAEAEDEEEAEDSPDSPSTEEKEEEIDYEAVAKAEKTRADKAESKLAGKAFKKREEKRETEDAEAEDEEDEDRPLSVKEYEKRREADRQSDLKTSRAKDAKTMIDDMTGSPEETEAVFQFWRGRVTPSDSLKDDVEIAFAGVNRKSLLGKNKELRRALKGKKGKNQPTGGDHPEPQENGKKPKVDGGMKVALKQAGFAYDTKAKHWAKKLPNGKTLVKKTPTSPPQLL